MTVRLLGGLLVTVMALYASPKRGGGQKHGSEKRRGKEGSGLYPELSAFRISEGTSPNVQDEVGRTVAEMPIALARKELARRGLELDEKAIHRIAGELGAQILATRTDELLKYREDKLEAGNEFAGKRIAVQIDGGRVRIRTVIIDGTLRGPDALIELVAFHLHRLGAAKAEKVVFLGDGARWIWNRIDWVVDKVGIDAAKVTQVLDFCHAVHHVSLALEDLKFSKTDRPKHFARLRNMLKRGQAEKVIGELESLAEGLPADRVVCREIRYLQRHFEANRLAYPFFRYCKLPLGSGAIESTIRRAINLRMKGNGIYWAEENAEEFFQLRAALLSDRWEEIVGHARERIARNRRLDWHWTPLEALAELKALEQQDKADAEPKAKPELARPAA